MPHNEPMSDYLVEPDNTAPNYVPELPDWEFWRQRGACRIWQAVLLSMNVEPTKTNRDQLSARAPDIYSEYRRRREIVIVQYGKHSLLPIMEHVRAGQMQSERYVALPKLLEFAKDICWRNLAAFDKGLSRSTVYLSGGETVEVQEDLEELAKGERYTLVRMGALLKILERFLQPTQANNRQQFLTGSSLNISALGREIEQVIATAAHEKGNATISRFTDEANRKQLAAAVKALSNYF